jgi:hypothetical protein
MAPCDASSDVRALRETLGLSQTDFSALFGFNVRSLAARRPPTAIHASDAVADRFSR